MDLLKDLFRRSKLLLQTAVLVAVFFGFDGWKTLKAIAAALGTHISLSQTILSWGWWTEEVVKVPFARIFLLVIGTGTLFNIIFTLRNRNRPITVLSTEVTLEFQNGGADVTYCRRQTIHANRPGITAYFMGVSFDAPTGKLKVGKNNQELVDAWIDNPNDLRVSPRLTKSGRSREIDLVYSAELPYSWVISLIPRWVLAWEPKRLPGFIGKYLVVQHMRYGMLNEYDGDDYAKYGAKTTRYSHQCITLTLDFSRDTGKRPQSEKEITVVRRLANAMSQESAKQTDRPGVYRVNINEGLARDEMLLVTWERN